MCILLNISAGNELHISSYYYNNKFHGTNLSKKLHWYLYTAVPTAHCIFFHSNIHMLKSLVIKMIFSIATEYYYSIILYIHSYRFYQMKLNKR